MLIQGLFIMLIMGAFASLSVDIGHYYLARAELQRAADAASLAGTSNLKDDDVAGAIQQSTSYALANQVAGETLPAAAISVIPGNWDDGVFQANGTPTNAIRVDVKRSITSGNPLRLFFGQFIGLSSVNIGASSVSRVDKADEYNLVGIDEATFGSIGVLAQVDGRIVSNGNVSIGYPLGIGVGVTGEARSFDGTVKKGLLAGITGSTQPLPKKLSYPSVRLPAANDNAQITGYLNPWNDFTAAVFATVPAGVYVVRDLNLVATTSLNFTGPVTFYVTRNCNIAGTVTLLGNSNFTSKNFKVRVAAGGCVNFVANLLTPMNMDMYAPDSDILVAVGVNAYKGRLIGKKLNILLPTLGSFKEELDLESPLYPTAIPVISR